ncbi:MAG: Ig-like domain-containing protein [Thermoleophilia bacterium]
MIRRISILLSFVIVFILFVVSQALATNVPVDVTDINAGSPGQAASQGRPEVSGDIITWKDNRFNSSSFWDIFAYSRSTHIESAVTTAAGYQNLPVTNGRYVVWQDNRNGPMQNDIWRRSLIPVTAEQPLVSAANHQLLPAISGDTVVYVNEGAGGNGTETDASNDIWAVDVNGGQPYPVCTNAGSQWQPRINGSMVVWQDNRNGHWNIWAKDLSTGNAPVPVTADTADDNKVADVNNGVVVWQKTHNGVNDIWMKDLNSSDPARPLTDTTDTAYESSPRISGDLVVYEHFDYQRANYDVYMINTEPGATPDPVAAGPTDEARPAIDGETVVWEAVTGTFQNDIWTARVPDMTAPSISNRMPADGANSGCETPTIAADYADNRVGIDTGSVTLTLDGADVTPDAQVGSQGVTYQPSAPLTEGIHTVVLTVADKAGNTAAASWSFTTNSPRLGVELVKSFWGSYDDYLNGDVSVQFRLTNSSGTVGLGNMEVIDSSTTAGVLMATPMPLIIGAINANSTADVVIKYRVPPGTTTFKTRMYVAATDICGLGYFFPGPPPGW